MGSEDKCYEPMIFAIDNNVTVEHINIIHAYVISIGIVYYLLLHCLLFST